MILAGHWNRNIVLQPHDRLFKYTLNRLIPSWVKPNHITVARMFSVPLVLYYLVKDNYNVGVPLFLIVALSDALDGSLARVRKQITEWGVIYDPVADKMFIGSILVVIVLNHINFFLGLALIVVEIIVIFGGWYRVRHGRIEPANVLGKIKMFAEVAGILALLAALWFKIDLFVDVSVGTLSLALVFGIASILSGSR